MKTIYDPATLNELTARISKLNMQSTAQWGKMNVYQMLRHNTLWEEMMLGKIKFRRVFIGRIFGKIALNDLIKDDRPLKRGMPTIKGFAITDTNGNIEEEKNKWIALLREHAGSTGKTFFHPFFGNMTKEQTGRLAYKHSNHHLQQFGC